MLIPKGFKPIAVRDDSGGKCVISHNPSSKEYFLVINDTGMGPISLAEMKQLVENMKDVIDLKGRFIYIEEYSPDGTFLGNAD